MPGPYTSCDVVVLEDDDLVRDVLTDIMECEGFAVHPAASAQDALALTEERRGYSLLLTDVDLGPGPSGFDAAREAQARHPSLAVIYLTGRHGHANARPFGPKERFLCKPFRTRELIDALRSLGVSPPASP